MNRRFRPSFESLERREVFSANPWTAAPVVESPAPTAAYTALPYIEQDNLAQKVQPQQQQIIAILIGLR
jgi:hypothetical protein